MNTFRYKPLELKGKNCKRYKLMKNKNEIL